MLKMLQLMKQSFIVTSANQGPTEIVNVFSLSLPQPHGQHPSFQHELSLPPMMQNITQTFSFIID